MTSVAYGSLVEVCDAPRGDGSHPDVRLERVEDLVAGDYVAHPYGGMPLRVERVVHHRTRGMWTLVSYLGLRADGMQMILVGRQMMRMCTWGEGAAQRCAGIVSLVLAHDHVARIDGVVCVTLQPEAGPPVVQYEGVRLRLGPHRTVVRAAGATGEEGEEGRSPTGVIPARPRGWCNAEPRVHATCDDE